MADGKGTHNVKFLTEKLDKNNYAAYTRVGNSTENTYAYAQQGEQLQGMLLMTNGKQFRGNAEAILTFLSYLPEKN